MPLAFLWKISSFLCNLHIMQGFKPQALYLRNKLFWAWFAPFATYHSLFWFWDWGWFVRVTCWHLHQRATMIEQRTKLSLFFRHWSVVYFVWHGGKKETENQWTVKKRELDARHQLFAKIRHLITIAITPSVSTLDFRHICSRAYDHVQG